MIGDPGMMLESHRKEKGSGHDVGEPLNRWDPDMMLESRQNEKGIRARC